MLAQPVVFGFKVIYIQTDVVRDGPLLCSIDSGFQEFVVFKRLHEFDRYSTISGRHVSDVGALELMCSSQKHDLREKWLECFNTLCSIPDQVGQMIKCHGCTCP